MVKLSFTGDLLCYALQNKVAQTDKYDYDYKFVFAPVADRLSACGYLCGSLETPLAEASWGYTASSINFNTPHQFGRDAKAAGFDMLTTGNNHCLDRGVLGMKNTIRVLDYYGIDHVGTYLNKETAEDIYVKDFDGFKVAFLSYTYGTNSRSNKHVLSPDEVTLVDLLRKQDQVTVRNVSLLRRFLSKCKSLAKRVITMRVAPNPVAAKPKIVLDSVPASEIANADNRPYLDRFEAKIRRARKVSDMVVLCLHSGGQFNFNVGVGEYTEYIVGLARKNGVNIIIGNHTHCVMPARLYDDRTFVAYALGNFCFTPGDGYYVDGVMADYSLLVNLEIDTAAKRISDVTFSVFKVVREADDSAAVHSVYDLYHAETDAAKRAVLEADNACVVNKFLGRDNGVVVVQDIYSLSSMLK